MKMSRKVLIAVDRVACKSVDYDVKWQIPDYWTCGKQEYFREVYMGNPGSNDGRSPVCEVSTVQRNNPPPRDSREAIRVGELGREPLNLQWLFSVSVGPENESGMESILSLR